MKERASSDQDEQWSIGEVGERREDKAETAPAPLFLVRECAMPIPLPIS